MIKKVQNNYYAHKSNIRELRNNLNAEQNRILSKAISTMGKREYTIVKYNRFNDAVSFIISPDWDSANEPTVGDSICIKSDGTIKKICGGTKIYHNKWQFCAENYDGFSISDAKRRTELWNSIPGINEKKKQIGNKKYWIELLKDNDIPL